MLNNCSVIECRLNSRTQSVIQKTDNDPLFKQHPNNNDDLYRPLHGGDNDGDGNVCVNDSSLSLSSKYEDGADSRQYQKNVAIITIEPSPLMTLPLDLEQHRSPHDGALRKRSFRVARWTVFRSLCTAYFRMLKSNIVPFSTLANTNSALGPRPRFLPASLGMVKVRRVLVFLARRPEKVRVSKIFDATLLIPTPLLPLHLLLL